MKIIAISLTFIVLALLVVHPLAEADTWMHIKTGQIMAEEMRMTWVDEYSYTKGGEQWLNHQWLSQIIFYIIYKFFSFNGLVIFSAIMIFLAFVLLFMAMRKKDNWLLAVFLILLIMLFSQNGFLARPLIFSLFLFALFIFILDRYKYFWLPEKENLLYLLIPIQVLWVNLHGASIMGIFLVWSYIAGEFIDNLRRNFKNDFVIRGNKYKKLFILGVILALSTGITPYGYDAILFPIKEFKGMHLINEWLPSVHNDILLNFNGMFYYRLFLFISIFVFIFKGRVISSAHIIIFALFLYLSLSGKRHLSLYGFAIAPCVTEYLKGVKFKAAAKPVKKYLIKTMTWVLISYLLLLGKDLITGRYYLNKGMDSWVGFGTGGYPEKAVDFVLSSGIKGNVFNDYGSGCYLIWKFYPERKVFIDGRNTIYGEKFLKEEFIPCFLDPSKFEKTVNRYKINYVFLYYGLSNTEALIPYLYNSDNWKLVYLDDKVCIFLKNNDENSDIINRHKVDLTVRKEVALNTYGWQKIYPRDYIDRAVFYEKIGLPDKAIETLKDVIKIMPDVKDAYYNLGSLYLAKGMHGDAVKVFKEALKLDKKDVEAYNNLGVTYARMGRYEDALAEFKKALWLNPLKVEAMRNMRLARIDYERERQSGK